MKLQTSQKKSETFFEHLGVTDEHFYSNAVINFRKTIYDLLEQKGVLYNINTSIANVFSVFCSFAENPEQLFLLGMHFQTILRDGELLVLMITPLNEDEQSRYNSSILERKSSTILKPTNLDPTLSIYEQFGFSKEFKSQLEMEWSTILLSHSARDPHHVIESHDIINILCNIEYQELEEVAIKGLIAGKLIHKIT